MLFALQGCQTRRPRTSTQPFDALLIDDRNNIISHILSLKVEFLRMGSLELAKVPNAAGSGDFQWF